jgi:hypothetical protein
VYAGTKDRTGDVQIPCEVGQIIRNVYEASEAQKLQPLEAIQNGSPGERSSSPSLPPGKLGRVHVLERLLQLNPGCVLCPIRERRYYLPSAYAHARRQGIEVEGS